MGTGVTWWPGCGVELGGVELVGVQVGSVAVQGVLSCGETVEQ